MAFNETYKTIYRAVTDVAYDSHVRNTENFGHNVFVNFSIGGLLELPAIFLTMLLSERVGRRHTTVGCLILGGIISLRIAFVSEGKLFPFFKYGTVRAKHS